MLCLGTALKLGPILRQPLSQTAPLQHGRKALHRRRPTLLRSLYRAISRGSYDQLGALKPVFGPERPLLLCRSQELGHSQRLHDLPPQWPAGDLADHDEILPLITAHLAADQCLQSWPPAGYISAGRRTARRVSTRCRATRYARCGVYNVNRGHPWNCRKRPMCRRDFAACLI